MKKIIAFMLALIFTFVLVGCGDDPASTSKEVETITLAGTNSVEVGQTTQFTATIAPADAEDTTVTWSSDDPSIATVDANGLVTCVAEGGTYIRATATNGVYGRRRIRVVATGTGEDYPNLDGYVIKIAQAAQALGNYDPTLPSYTAQNKDARLDAWNFVADKFNCTIEVVAYPSSADWGPSRWNYILNQAAQGVSDYDFLTVPDSQIPQFVEGNALIDLTDWYALYGDGFMDPSYITSGTYKNKLYSVVDGDNSIYNVMYYNNGLYKALAQQDPTLKEPAQMFLDGEWTYENFITYCTNAQTAMAALYGEAGTAGNSNQTYFAVSGWSTYWWVGLAAVDGVPLADITNFSVNFDTPHKLAAIDTIKTLYSNGLADPSENVDQSVASWNAGNALFNTGDLWFVRDNDRWNATLWGEGTTEYGYVPFPMPGDMTLDDYRVALGGTATWVMPVGRDYSSYGADVTAENIYRAIVTMFQKTEELYEGSASYDVDLALQTTAARYADTEASQKAFIYVSNLIKAGKGFYDPLVTSDNSVASLYSASSSSNITYAVRGYCRGNVGSVQAHNTWAEAIADVVPTVRENLRKAFS